MYDNDALTLTTLKPGVLKLARRRRMFMAWSVWFVAAAFTLFQFFLQLSSGVMIDALMKSFSLAAFGAGILAGSYYYIYTALQIPAGERRENVEVERKFLHAEGFAPERI